MKTPCHLLGIRLVLPFPDPQPKLPAQKHRLGNSGVSHRRVREQGSPDKIPILFSCFVNAFLIFFLILVNKAGVFRTEVFSDHK